MRTANASRAGGRYAFNSHDRVDRFLVIVEAAARFKAQSFLIDGEVVIARDDGMLDFHPLRSQRRAVTSQASVGTRAVNAAP